MPFVLVDRIAKGGAENGLGSCNSQAVLLFVDLRRTPRPGVVFRWAARSGVGPLTSE